MSDPGETFAYLTFPILPPEKLLGDYLRSKLELQAVRKYPQWDIPRLDPLIKLVAVRRDQYKAELQLSVKKEEAQEQRKKLDAQWDELQRDAEKLKQTFCEFDKMVKQNIQKRDRAVIKSQKQLVLQQDREKAIRELETEYDRLLKIKDKMEYQLKIHAIYEEYLQTVADANPEFKTHKDVFDKFAVIYEARVTLTQQFKESLTTLEDMKSEITKLTNDYSSILMGLGNRISNLHKRHAIAKANAEKWDGIVRNIQMKCGERLEEILSVRKVCSNIYLNMCRHKRTEPKIRPKDFESQLSYIKKNLMQLEKTLGISLEKTTEEKISSMAAETSKTKSE